MSADFKPGDVALIEVGCHANRHLGVFIGSGFLGGWRYGDDKWAANDPAIVTARRLVVIDPEDREQVERLVDCYRNASGYLAVDSFQIALRKFANPRVKPEEPTGLAGLVRYDGSEWIGLDKHRWLEIPADEHVEPRRWHWNDFPADVEVVREGWSE